MPESSVNPKLAAAVWAGGPPQRLSRPDIAVREADPVDLERLALIEAASFETDRISRRSFRLLLRSSTATCLVAVADGAVVGYAVLLRRAKTMPARLYSIAVQQSARGTGVGRRLLEAAEAAALGLGCSALRLEVRESSEAAAFYRRAGYRPIRHLADYYADHADALRLEKRLAA